MGVQPLGRWQAPGRCDTNACVQVRGESEGVYVRRSGGDSFVLRFTHAEWQAFVGAAKDGQYDFDLDGENRG